MKYNSQKIEKEIYIFWEKKKYFKYKYNSKNNFCIMLPPPNITGNLHIGHAFQQTIMDFVIRFNRMNEKNVLWQPGLDHAGIATQILIEKYFNLNKLEYNKKSLINKTIKWKNDLSKSIIYQMKCLGNSIYWSNIRFTMDKNFTYSVKYAFILLYREKLIYKNKKIVNWDFKLKSSISDLEVVYKKIQGKLWYIKYQIINNKKEKEYIIISTTRPETLLGNVAIVVNPDDIRYKHLIGKSVIIPIINKPIPIIYDKKVNINYGSGCMNLTPAHCFKDYEISIKHSLPIINIFTVDGKIKKEAEIIFNIENKENININFYKLPKYLSNLNIKLARDKILNILKSLNLIYKEEYSIINVPYNERNKSIVNFIITDQWYLKTKEISKNAIEIVKKNNINFFPKKYKKIYLDWMYNIKDWCISRQIWWGHKIPAWYDINKNIYVGFNKKDVINYYNLSKNIKLYKENDVLDTWFSSSLWTFASLGWPKNTKKMKLFHPTDLIVSGHDIIFFWISRMIMLTIFLIKEKNINNRIPFKNVYITGLINDEYGKKMSKSNGNILDPIDLINGISLKDLIYKKINLNLVNLNKNEIIKNTKLKFPNGIESFGADSLRLTFLSLSTNNKNINFNIKKINEYKNFCIKLWNAGQFILKSCNNINKNKFIKRETYNYNLFHNKFIISYFNKTLSKLLININEYKFNEFIKLIYNFFWNEFCNWHIEISKYFFIYNNKIKKKYIYETELTLLNIFNNILKILHPSIPFITEKIWQLLINKYKFIDIKNKKTISLQNFPKINNNYINIENEKNFEIIKKIIFIIRKKKINLLKKNKNIKKINIKINVYKKDNYINLFNKENIKIIKFITKINNLYIIYNENKINNEIN